MSRSGTRVGVGVPVMLVRISPLVCDLMRNPSCVLIDSKLN